MIPIKLTLTNFISHINSVLDFTKFDVALIIGATEGDANIANGCGKTSINDGIRFALFGKTRFSSKTKAVKRGKEYAVVEFIFEIGGNTYKIVRRLSARTGIITVEFAKKEGNTWDYKGYTCDTPTQTNNKIIELVGMNDDIFVNISYFKQNDVSGFASANATKRKEILKECLRIGIWDEYQKVAKDSERALNQQLILLEERIKFLGSVEQDIEKLKNKTIEKEKEIERIKVEVEKVEEKYSKCNEKIISAEQSLVKKGVVDIKRLEVELEAINKKEKELIVKKDNLIKRIKNNNISLSNANNECEKLLEKNQQYYKDILQTDNRNRKDILKIYKENYKDSIPTIIYSESNLIENREKRTEIKKNLDIFLFELGQLNALEPGEICPTCLSEIKNPESIIQKREERKKFLNNKIEICKKELKELTASITEEEEFIKKAEIASVEIERTNLIIAKRMNAITEANKDNENIQEEKSKLVNEAKELQSKKEEIVDFIKKTKESNLNKVLTELYEQKNKLEIEKSKVKESVIKATLEKENYGVFKEDLERKLSEKNILLAEKENLVFNISIYSKLNYAFGKDGIPSLIFENITEDLKQYTNSILKNIYFKPISVDFITQKQTGTGIWKEDFEIVIMIDNEVYDFEDISGGEQVRISIALRLALSQLLMNRMGSNVQFLLFDEVDQSLDRHGLEALYETIQQLSKEFKILIISHSDYMKEKFENIITVFMTNGGSVLK